MEGGIPAEVDHHLGWATGALSSTDGLLLPACSGEVLLLGPARFDSSGVTAEGFSCLSGKGDVDEWQRWVTEDGRQTSLEALAAEDRRAFVDGGAVDPLLREQLEKSGPGEVIRAHLWFAVALPEEPDAAEALMDPRLQEATDAERDTSILATATGLARAVADRASATRSDSLRVLSRAPEAGRWGPPRLIVEGTREDLEWLARLDEAVELLPDPGPGAPASPAYFDLVNAGWLDNFGAGLDGTNITIAVLERDRFDNTWHLPGLGSSGNCYPPNGGYAYRCHCPGGPDTSHPRAMAGLQRNSVVFTHGVDGLGGVSDQARRVSANFMGGCVTHGADQYTSAIGWGLAEGARVFSQSFTFEAGSPQSSYDRVVDWFAAASPYPFFAGAAGNDGVTQRTLNNFRNGLVVGGSDDQGTETRAGSTMWDEAPNRGSRSANYLGSAGFEVPHLVAPARGNMDTAGDGLYSVGVTGATSAATAVTSGLAASLMELNPALISRPEATMAGLMASADEDVDGTVLSFGNLIDERDGAGLVNGLDAMFLLDAASKRDGGASPVAYGHDYNVITAASTPENQAYAETWRTQVGPGQTLRAVFVSLAKPVCESPVTDQNCTSSSHAGFSLRAFSSGGLPLTSSYSASNNYSYLTYKNTGASSATIDLKVVPIAWLGLTSTKTSIAWVAE